MRSSSIEKTTSNVRTDDPAFNTRARTSTTDHTGPSSDTRMATLFAQEEEKLDIEEQIAPIEPISY